MLFFRITIASGDPFAHWLLPPSSSRRRVRGHRDKGVCASLIFYFRLFCLSLSLRAHDEEAVVDFSSGCRLLFDDGSASCCFPS